MLLVSIQTRVILSININFVLLLLLYLWKLTKDFYPFFIQRYEKLWEGMEEPLPQPLPVYGPGLYLLQLIDFVVILNVLIKWIWPIIIGTQFCHWSSIFHVCFKISQMYLCLKLSSVVIYFIKELSISTFSPINFASLQCLDFQSCCFSFFFSFF